MLKICGLWNGHHFVFFVRTEKVLLIIQRGHGGCCDRSHRSMFFAFATGEMFREVYFDSTLVWIRAL